MLRPILIAAALCAAAPAVADCADPDRDAVFVVIKQHLGLAEDSAADWMARQMMKPDLMAATIQTDPVLATALQLYDSSKVFAFMVSNCADLLPSEVGMSEWRARTGGGS